MRAVKLDCGCSHNDTHWTVVCPACAAEGAEYHAAFMEHRSVGQPVGFVPKPPAVFEPSPATKFVAEVMLAAPPAEDFSSLFDNL